MSRDRNWLTEPMFYVLMSFLRGEMCGIEITEFVAEKTGGRVNLGPGTLYTILGKFQGEKLIREVSVEGRKRTYVLTEEGRRAYEEEVNRLRTCLMDAEGEGVYEDSKKDALGERLRPGGLGALDGIHGRKGPVFSG